MPHRTLVFSHANSFPASTYRSLFEGWRAAGWEVHAIDKIGHDPRFPVSTDWPHLVAQLAQFIEREVAHPVYLVGHSLGGYLSMMVASRHPHLAQGVVVLDSPLLYGWKGAGIGLAKRLDAMQRVMPPSRVAAQRTEEWPSLDAARRHFQLKPKFAAFHPAVLGDYLHTGIEAHDEGRQNTTRRLSFRRDIETAIYNTMPHELLAEFRRHPPRCPMAFIGGTHSRELRAVGLRGTERLFGPRISWIDGTHLYPFEQPQLTTQEVLQWLQRFEREARD
jgi:pimeloyl-ACP methyl ester carboxylesterase